MEFIADKTFGKSFAFRPAEYDGCVFENCDFSKLDLSGSTFADCVFTDCNFSMAASGKTSFRDVSFSGCKLIGFRFDQCNAMLFSARFEHCQLDLCSFYRFKLRKQLFSGCSMREVDFSEADLSAAVFRNCDLSGAVFDNTILEKADLRETERFSIDPEKNNVRGAKISVSSAPALLQKYGLEFYP